MGMQAGKLERNDSCPCGSGKKYKKCCMGKDSSAPLPTSVAYTNYNGEEARFSPREADRAAERLKLLLDSLHYRREPGIKKGIQSLQEIYDLFAALQSHFTARASCQKGCGFCCQLHITVTRLEAEVARLYILSVFDQAAQVAVVNKISQSKDQYLCQDELESLKNCPAALEQMLDSYLSKQIPCPFLSESGVCTIYSFRPFSCRSLVVISHPNDCQNHKGIQIKPYNINEYVLASIANLSKKVFGENSGEKHFPAWFIEGFRG